MKKAKILIVEDQSIVALEIKIELEKFNCEIVGMVHTKEQVLNLIKTNEPDIILMDINLGKNEDGISIVEEIHQKKKIPVLYLTAFSDDLIMNRAFSTNPIGYIVKPFKINDLKTNIQLAMYKINSIASSTLNQDYLYLGEDFYFDTDNSQLYYKDKFVKLGSKENKLLSLLIKANYNVIQFSDLEESIWDGHKPSTSALRTLVYRLKGKLGSNIIETTYGYGYGLKSSN